MTKDPAPFDFTEVIKIQERAVGEVLGELEHSNVVLLEAPTGAGKTRINARLIHEMEKRARGEFSALNLCHREMLAGQNKENFAKWAPDSSLTASVASNGDFDQSASNVYALVQTVAPRIEDIKRYDLVGIDEAHHASDSKKGDFNQIAMAIIEKHPETKFVLVTATPSRPDQKGLAKPFRDCPRVTIGWKELERAGQIILPNTKDCAVLSDDGISLNSVARAHYKPEKDAEAAGLTKALRKARPADFNAQAASEWERQASDLKTLAYASRIEDARSFKEEMASRGHRVDVMDSQMGKEHNEDVLARYGRGELDMVVSVKMLDEGIDVPATRCVLILREMTSEIEYSQMVGRALRAGQDEKLRSVKPVVLDMGASTMIHGSIERRAEVIDYVQKLQRAQRDGKTFDAPAPKALVEGLETKSDQPIVARDGAYTPWRRLRDKPVVLGLTDGKSVILAIESRDATGKPRYTIGESAVTSEKTRAKKLGSINSFQIMKGANNRPLFAVEGSILQQIETSRIIPSRASLLRMEASASSEPDKRSTLVDDRLAKAIEDKQIDSIVAYQAKMQQYASR